MKSIALAIALATGTALSLPAFAEGTGADATMKSETETQAGMQSGQEAAGLSGENLDENEVREVQQALKDAGADIEVDGVWGDSTAQALSAYQRDEGLTPSGELDQRTIASLGVSVEAPDTQQAEIPEEKPETGMESDPSMQAPDTDAGEGTAQ